MRLRVLGSSSSGNCSLFWSDSSALLVDCGFSRSFLWSSLQSLDLELPPLSGLLLTHAHGDHVNDSAVDLLVRNRVPVYVRRELTRVLQRLYPSLRRAARAGLLQELGPAPQTIGGFEVDSFPVPHDSPGGCFGFGLTDRSSAGGARAAIATDLGFPGEDLLERFRGARAAVIESNHDVAMLENSGRPPWLKKRIREIGHLSNDQCAGFVAELVRTSAAPPAAVVLAHISQQCNTNALARGATAGALEREGCSTVRIVESFRSRPSEIVTV